MLHACVQARALQGLAPCMQQALRLLKCLLVSSLIFQEKFSLCLLGPGHRLRGAFNLPYSTHNLSRGTTLDELMHAHTAQPASCWCTCHRHPRTATHITCTPCCCQATMLAGPTHVTRILRAAPTISLGLVHPRPSLDIHSTRSTNLPDPTCPGRVGSQQAGSQQVAGSPTARVLVRVGKGGMGEESGTPGALLALDTGGGLSDPGHGWRVTRRGRGWRVCAQVQGSSHDTPPSPQHSPPPRTAHYNNRATSA